MAGTVAGLQISAEAHQALIDQLADRLPVTNLVQAIAAAFAFALLYPQRVVAALVASALVAVLSVVRAVWLYLAPRPISRRNLAWSRVSTWIVGALWCIAFALGAVGAGSDVRAVLLVIAVGLVTAAGATLYNDLPSASGYIVLTLGGAVFALLRAADRPAMIAAPCLVIFGILTAVILRGRRDRQFSLIASNESLARQARELNLLNADLRVAREEAMAAMASRQMFLANVSHEIRTPLNGIVGMTGLLLDSELDTDQLECATTVRTCASSLLELINDILDFSKIDAGHLDVEVSEFDLQSVLDDAIEMLAERARQRGLELNCSLDPSLPRIVSGDAGRFRQVILNLAGNAIKFTEHGEVLVEAERVSLAEGKVTVRVTIRDTGIGISADQVQRLFKPFSQVDPSMTRRFGGTGLGLVISKQIAEKMGGTIDLESEPGQGSTFRFTAVLACTADSRLVGWRAPAELSGTRVLVADPSATGRRVLAKAVEAAGLAVEVLENPVAVPGALAAAATSGAPFRVALVALRALDYGADALARDMRRESPDAMGSVVILAPMGFRGDEARVQRQGFAAFMSLPVRRSRLDQLFLEILAGKPRDYARERRAAGAGMAAGGRILLAEDNPVNQKVAVRVLERLGYMVDVAENGVHALAALAAERYDALVTDVQMPEMDGLGLAAEVRRREAGGRRLPIIAMTAHAQPSDREQCLAAGMDDYVSKPIAPDELARVLARWIVHPGPESTDSPGDAAALTAGSTP